MLGTDIKGVAMRHSRFTLRALVLCLSAAFVPAAFAAKDEVRLIVGHKANAGGAVRAELARGGGRVVEDLSEINTLVVSMPRGAARALARHAQVDFVDEPVERHVLGSRSVRVAGSQAQTQPYGRPTSSPTGRPATGACASWTRASTAAMKIWRACR
jgi:hypothetical protein